MTTHDQNDRPDHDPIRVMMHDGSVYAVDNQAWLRAFEQKYGGDDRDEVLRAFRASVAEHWDNRTKPWKGITLPWDADPVTGETTSGYEDHADLAHEVMYSSLRAPLMAIAMHDLRQADHSADDGDHDSPSVIGIRADGVVAYTGEEAIEYDSIDDILPDPVSDHCDPDDPDESANDT